jgi:cell division protein FtsQ
MWWLTRRNRESKSAKRKPVRGLFPLSRRMQIGLRIAAGLAVAAIAAGGAMWLWQSGRVAVAADGAHRLFVAETRRMGLTVQDVQLEGRHLAPWQSVERAVGLHRGDAMLGFDPAEIRRRLVAIPWVRDASVERRLPGTVRIRIQERRPMALWQRDGKLALVDDEGVVISENESDIAHFRNLLIVVGSDAPRHAPTLIAMIRSEPALARRVSAAVRVGERRWNIELAGGVKVELPERNPHDAWRRLAELQARDRLLERDVRTIDMRLPDRMIVRTGESIGEKRPKAKGRNT